MFDNSVLKELYKKYLDISFENEECDICRISLPDYFYIMFECSHKACLNCCSQLRKTTCHLCRNFIPELNIIVGSKKRIINYNNKLALKSFKNKDYKKSISLYYIGLKEGYNNNYYDISECYRYMDNTKKQIEYSFNYLLTLPLIVQSSILTDDYNDRIFNSYIAICSYIFDNKKSDDDLRNILNISNTFLNKNYINNIKKRIILNHNYNDLLKKNICIYFFLNGYININIDKSKSIKNYFNLILLNKSIVSEKQSEIYEYLIDNYNCFYNIEIGKEIQFLIENEDNCYKNDILQIKNKKEKINLDDYMRILNKNSFFDDNLFFIKQKNLSKCYNKEFLLIFHYLVYCRDIKNDKYYKYLNEFIKININKFNESTNSGIILPEYVEFLLQMIDNELKNSNLKNKYNLLNFKNEILSLIIKKSINRLSDSHKQILLDELNNKYEKNKKRKKN
jgi:hypothetical protein